MITSLKCSFASLIIGFVLGFFLTKILMLSTFLEPQWSSHSNPHHATVNKFVDKAEYKKDIETSDHSRDNVSIAERLYNETRVLCMVMTNSINHKNRSRHIARTWGRRCNKLLFFSNASDSTLGTIVLNVEEVNDSKWLSAIAAFKYVFDNHLNDTDWFFKVDDTTYAIVENLRYMLYPYSPDAPIYFRSKLQSFTKQRFASLYSGTGYVLSRQALRLFVEKGLKSKHSCSQYGKAIEDVEVGRCLANIQVRVGNSRDSEGRERFFLFPPELLIRRPKYLFNKTDMSLDTVSNYAITFHYISPNQMYVLHYFIYHVRSYGIVLMPEPLPIKRPNNNKALP